MSQILTHRFSNKVYEWKVTPNGHYMLRQIYRDCSGLKPSKWQRVLSATVKQLVNESIEYGSEEVKKVKHKELIHTDSIGWNKRKCGIAYAVWSLIFIALLVALHFGLVMRGVL